METTAAVLSFVLWLLGAGSPFNTDERLRENPFIEACVEGYVSVESRELCKVVYTKLYIEYQRELRQEVKQYWCAGWEPDLLYAEAVKCRSFTDSVYFCAGPDWERLIDYATRSGQTEVEINRWRREVALDGLYYVPCEGCGDFHGIEGDPEKAYDLLVDVGEQDGLKPAAEYIAKKYLEVFTDAFEECPYKGPVKYHFRQADLKRSIDWFVKAQWPNHKIRRVVANTKPRLKINGAPKEVIQMVEAELKTL